MEFVEDFLFDYRRRVVVLIGQDIVNGSVQGITYMNQSRKGYFYPVVFYIANVIGVYISVLAI